jgi:hypothetical protein
VSSSRPPRRLAGPFPRDAEDLGGDWLSTALGLAPDEQHRTEVSQIGHGRGHMGSAYRMRFLHDDARHPARSLVVKLPAPDGAARDTAERGGLYEREVRFFLDVAPRTPLRVPTCYAAGYAADGGFALLLEDLGGAQEIDQVVGIDLPRAHRVLQQLADFHSAWWESPQLDDMAWATRHTDEHRVANLTSILRQGWPRLVDALQDQLPHGCGPAGQDMADLLPAAFGVLAHAPQTLLHGDARLDNMLFEPDADAPAAILDWQSVSRGSAAVDVSFFLAQNLPASELQQHGDELLRTYHRRLADAGVAHDLHELRRAVSLALPLTFAVASSLFVLADVQEPRTRDLAAAMAQRALTAAEVFGHPRDLLVGV